MEYTGQTTLAEIASEIGAEDHVELVTKLRAGYERGKSIEHIEQLAQATLASVELVQKMQAEYMERKQAEQDDEAFQAAMLEKAFKTYSELPDGDPQKSKIQEHFSKTLGLNDAQILLEGDAYAKALQAPISPKNDKFEDWNLIRKCHDFLMLYCAAKDGIASAKVTKGRHESEPALMIDKTVLKRGFEVLKEQQMEGIELLEKAINTALDSTTSTEGLEWVPAQILSRNMYQDIWLALTVPANFQRFVAPGPTFAVPIRTQRSRLYGMDEAKAVSDYFTIKAVASAMATDKITFTARKAGILNLMSDELVDDSAVAILEEVYNDIVYGSADGIEDAVINGSRALGDLDNQQADTHRLWNNSSDGGDGIRLATGATDARYLWDGIRKSAIACGLASVTSSSFARSEMLAVRGKMGKYGTNPTDLFWVVSPQHYIKMLAFPEVATMEKYGVNATVLRGELAKLDNIPILISPRIYTNLAATGVFTDGVSSTATNLSEAILVNKRGYAFADRMNMRVESDRMMLSGQRAILGTMRLDFKKMFHSNEPTEGTLIALA